MARSQVETGEFVQRRLVVGVRFDLGLETRNRNFWRLRRGGRQRSWSGRSACRRRRARARLRGAEAGAACCQNGGRGHDADGKELNEFSQNFFPIVELMRGMRRSL